MGYKKIPTKDLSQNEWLRLRKTGLGGSDIGAICGVNKYSSPIKIYQDKVSDEVVDNQTEATRIGQDLEDYCAKRFTEATGLKVRRSNYMYRSTKYPFMIADVDRLIVGEDAGLECKTTNIMNASQWKNGQVPISYVMQCYHYMYCTGKRVWYIACVIMGKEFVYRKLEWNDEIINNLINVESNFWNNHVLKRIMPEPDGSDSCGKAILGLFPTAEPESYVELKGFEDKLVRRDNLRAEIAELNREINKIEQEVQLSMKGIEFATTGSHKIKWHNVESTRLDTQRLRKEKPEIYDMYSTKSVIRRFQIKSA